MKVDLRSRQRSERNRRKSHTQPRADHIEIWRQARDGGRDQALERRVDDAVKAGEDVESCGVGDGEPCVGDDCHAEEDGDDGVEGAKLVGEEGRDYSGWEAGRCC